MKRCSKCGEEKAVEEFCRDRSQKSGRDSSCKTCRNATSRKWREANREKSRAASKRWNEANRERVAQNKLSWARDNPEIRAEGVRRREQQHPEKGKAVKALNYAIRSGEITRPGYCEDCGSEGEPFADGRASIQAHHEDYSKPLEVKWLCHLCHTKLHNKE